MSPVETAMARLLSAECRVRDADAGLGALANVRQRRHSSDQLNSILAERAVPAIEADLLWHDQEQRLLRCRTHALEDGEVALARLSKVLAKGCLAEGVQSIPIGWQARYMPQHSKSLGAKEPLIGPEGVQAALSLVVDCASAFSALNSRQRAGSSPPAAHHLNDGPPPNDIEELHPVQREMLALEEDWRRLSAYPKSPHLEQVSRAHYRAAAQRQKFGLSRRPALSQRHESGIAQAPSMQVGHKWARSPQGDGWCLVQSTASNTRPLHGISGPKTPRIRCRTPERYAGRCSPAAGLLSMRR